ncbi:hypothetical protein NDU88_003472 [Pleurodeles waltl]|uniref:Uncharacterized protein n=1 Tax=Pleurodeles waltl TaxID=8319 RepID=A0AAV7M736_PLEWA|nr:hypothetical protein NDU88_003472 [Pleurodeles waltl]
MQRSERSICVDPTRGQFLLDHQVSSVLSQDPSPGFFPGREYLESRGLRTPSRSTPTAVMTPSVVLTFEKAILKEVAKMKILRSFDNMPSGQHRVIKALSEDSSIMIKPAGKGGAIVVMDTTDYDQECLHQLANEKYYCRLGSDSTDTLRKQIQSMVTIPEAQNWVTKNEAEFLENILPTIPHFYILPKIHKEDIPPPGRPIVSGISSLLEPLSLVTTCNRWSEKTLLFSKTPGMC